MATGCNSTRYAKCDGMIIGKTSKYILARLKNIMKCKKIVNFTPGRAISLKSDALENNISTARELQQILSKKRLALFLLGLKH